MDFFLTSVRIGRYTFPQKAHLQQAFFLSLFEGIEFQFEEVFHARTTGTGGQSE